MPGTTEDPSPASLSDRGVELSEKGTIEAFEHAAATGSITLDAATNRRIVRKIDWQLMPVLCVTYALQYYDKALISQAAVWGFREDLDLEVGLRYSWATLIFFFGHIVGMYPCSLLAQRYRPRRVCTALTILWSAIVLSTPGCSAYSHILANRFFLGVVESGVSPIFMLVVGLWYTKQEHSYRSAWWYACSGGSLLISPVVNFGLAHITDGPMKPWKYMYFVAGGLTLIWGIALIWLFPGVPEDAKGWSPEDRALLLARIARDNAGAENRTWKSSQVKEAFLDWQFWALALMALLSNTAAATLSTFASIVFSGMGFTLHQSLLLNMPFGVMAFTSVLGAGWLANTRVGRLYTASICCLPVILGCCLVWQLPNSKRGGRIVGLYIINFFASCWLQAISLGTSNVAGYSKRGIYASGIWIGYCVGNIVGPLLFHQRYAPRYDQGFIGILTCFVVLFCLTIVIRFFLARRNASRDDRYGEPDFSHGTEDHTDKENKSFRYRL